MDPCQPNPCGEHMVCMKTDAVTYRCNCIKDYKMKDEKCEKGMLLFYTLAGLGLTRSLHLLGFPRRISYTSCRGN